MMKNNKGQQASLALLGSLALTLIAVIIASAIGSRVIDRIDNTFTDGTVQANITFAGTNSLEPIADFLPILGLLAITTIIITVVKNF